MMRMKRIINNNTQYGLITNPTERKFREKSSRYCPVIVFFFCIFVVKKLNHLYLKAKAKAEDF